MPLVAGQLLNFLHRDPLCGQIELEQPSELFGFSESRIRAKADSGIQPRRYDGEKLPVRNHP